MEAMMVAAQHPDAAQRAAQVGVGTVHAVERAGGGDIKNGGKVMAGAAVVAGVAVGVAAGPMLGVAAAGGAAYAATRNDKIGDAAKSTGKAAVAIGSKAVDINREHHITDRIGSAAKKSVAAVQAFDRRHDASGKIAGGITKVANGITKALQPKAAAAAAQTQQPQLVVPPPPPPPPIGHQGVYPARPPQ